MKKLLIATVSAVALFTSAAMAGPIAIINGASGTSEPGTTSSITTQLTTLHEAVGNGVTVLDTLPADLSIYDQVWDVRFSNTWALTQAEEDDFLAYLQGGGGMFVMGENSGFAARNNSVLSLIEAAGGGTLNFSSVSSTQTVLAPFTGPNAVATVNYAAPGGVDDNGSGDWITTDGVGGTGVAWGVGDLSNALAGALTTIFDVNFMMDTANAESQALTANLIGFIENEVTPPGPRPVSTPAIFALFSLAIAGLIRARKQA